MRTVDVAVVPTIADDAAPRVAELCRRLDGLADRTVVIVNGEAVGRELALHSLPARTSVIDAGCNLGFGGGVNAGVAWAGEVERALVVNDDVVLGPLFDAQLAAQVERMAVERLAAISLVDGSIGALRAVPTSVGTVMRVAGLWPIARRWNARIRRQRQLEFYLVLVDGSAWRDVGGFDGHFPLYFEDADIVARWSRVGRNVAAAQCDLTHSGSQSSRRYAETIACLSYGAFQYMIRDLGWVHRRASGTLRIANAVGIISALVRRRRHEMRPRLEIIRRPLGRLEAPLPPYAASEMQPPSSGQRALR
ncbi:glycosyltransferase family 2 protein [Ilumatobacter sp.]|uniref:glycosyltransferase family 2 protein n=1 Tax=Ilumatobacter sp. TaxID=1967498 RepID=UPI0037521D8C